VSDVATPDPLSAAKAYQRLLLEALGADPPDVVQAETPGTLRGLVVEAGGDLRTRPAPREWSVLLCIAHLVDAEVAWAPRFRFVLAHDRPELPGYDQDRWVDRLHTEDEDPDTLLRLYEPLRASTIELWRRASAQDRERVGIHGERGPESFDVMFRMLAGHDRVHLAQARRALETVRGRPAS
jgi:DinB superfamily